MTLLILNFLNGNHTHVARCSDDSISDLVGGGTDLLKVDHARIGRVAPRILGIIGGRHVVEAEVVFLVRAPI